jgi:hypothetical protein
MDMAWICGVDLKLAETQAAAAELTRETLVRDGVDPADPPATYIRRTALIGARAAHDPERVLAAGYTPTDGFPVHCAISTWDAGLTWLFQHARDPAEIAPRP